MNDTPVIIAAVLLALGAGVLFGCVTQRDYDDHQAAAHKAGHFNLTTGVFEWDK